MLHKSHSSINQSKENFRFFLSINFHKTFGITKPFTIVFLVGFQKPTATFIDGQIGPFENI